MNVLEQMMGYYDKGLEELMGATGYLDDYEAATTHELKTMYHDLVMQEIDHACRFMKAGDQLMGTADSSDPLPTVWSHLKKHLHEWKSRLMARLSDK